MQDAVTPKKRWKGYVCPACRMVFRVASDYPSSGVICSSCHHLLQIPTPGAKDVPLINQKLQQDAKIRMMARGVDSETIAEKVGDKKSDLQREEEALASELVLDEAKGTETENSDQAE